MCAISRCWSPVGLVYVLVMAVTVIMIIDIFAKYGSDKFLYRFQILFFIYKVEYYSHKGLYLDVCYVLEVGEVFCFAGHVLSILPSRGKSLYHSNFSLNLVSCNFWKLFVIKTYAFSLTFLKGLVLYRVSSFLCSCIYNVFLSFLHGFYQMSVQRNTSQIYPMRLVSKLMVPQRSTSCTSLILYVTYYHDDVIKWKHFPRYWSFVRGNRRSPVNFPHKGQRRGALMFSLICAWTNGWANNRDVGDLRHHRAPYGVTVMVSCTCGPFY